jgi:sigma-E factor negative regulatory protein RseB
MGVSSVINPVSEIAPRLVTLAIGAWLCCLCGWAAAESNTARADETQAWLARMVQSVQRLNYDGTFVYKRGNQIQAMRIVHMADERGERERLQSLTGVAREILRDNNALTCILPDKKAVMVEKNLPRQPLTARLPRDTQRLSRYYGFSFEGADRIAGKQTRIIRIRPHDNYRYGYRMWLDLDNAMLLRSDMLDENGRSIEQMMFTTISYPVTVSPETLAPEISGEGYAWRTHADDEQEQPVSARRWKVTRLPEGFELQHNTLHGMPDSDHPVEHQLYGDELASVSVYIEPANPRKKHLQGGSRMGAVSAYGSEQNGHQITVVGEVPPATVKLIGTSIQATGVAGPAP